MKKLLILAIVSIAVFSSCNKDKCETTTEKVAGTYRVTSAKYKQTSSSPEVDLLLALDACERDDLEVLDKNGVYTHQDAGTTCTPNGGYTASWSLNGNTITLDGESGTISSFDCKTMVFVVSGYFTAGDAATFTLAKQ